MAESKKKGLLQLELPFGKVPRATVPSAPAPVVAAKAPEAPVRTVTPISGTPGSSRPPLRVIRGEGRKSQEPLDSRDAVVRVLLEAGADLLLRRISAERAGEIEAQVDKILSLFDEVDSTPALMPKLKRCLDELETLMRETRDHRTVRRGG
jgi:hypothetical protein